MRKRLGFAIAVVALVVAAVVVPVGSAATKKTHKLQGTLVARGLEGNTVTGTFKGQPGSGAVIYVISTGPNGTQNLAITGFFAKGTLKAKGNVTIVPQPDGTATFTGSAKIVGGTGGYKGAKGNFTTTGTIDKDGIIRGDNVGTVKY
jgi:hypothetical protein